MTFKNRDNYPAWLTPATFSGLGKFTQRHYILLSYALDGGLAPNKERQGHARMLWGRFVEKHPELRSSLV